MTDHLTLYVLAACGVVLSVSLFFFLRSLSQKRNDNYRKDLEAVRHTSAPEQTPPPVPLPLHLSRTAVRTDCMAKAVTVEVQDTPGWKAEAETGAEGDASWLRVVKASEQQLTLHLLTNFGVSEREATVRVFYPRRDERSARDSPHPCLAV